MRGYVTMEAVPPFAVKGKDEPVIAHGLMTIGARRRRSNAESLCRA